MLPHQPFALQPQRRRAVGPGQRPARPPRRRSPRARAAVATSERQHRPGRWRCRSPSRPGMRPEGIGRFGSLIASTCAVEPVVDRLAGAADQRPGQQRCPATISGQRPVAGSPEETTPQANAHIGANQVIGFSSSRQADSGRARGACGASIASHRHALSRPRPGRSPRP